MTGTCVRLLGLYAHATSPRLVWRRPRSSCPCAPHHQHPRCTHQHTRCACQHPPCDRRRCPLPRPAPCADLGRAAHPGASPLAAAPQGCGRGGPPRSRPAQHRREERKRQRQRSAGRPGQLSQALAPPQQPYSLRTASWCSADGRFQGAHCSPCAPCVLPTLWHDKACTAAEIRVQSCAETNCPGCRRSIRLGAGQPRGQAWHSYERALRMRSAETSATLSPGHRRHSSSAQHTPATPPPTTT